MIIYNTISSPSLNTPNINYTLILPAQIQKTCLWLHGYKEGSNDILLFSNLEDLAERYQTAILLPDVPDTYYLNQHWNNCFTENFLITDFLPEILISHNLPSNHASVSIAGCSMGGYGSILIGAHFGSHFGKIISISGAFIIHDLLIGNPEVIGSVNNLQHFQHLFGDISSLGDSYSRNPEAAALQILKLNQQLPKIFMACGKEDMLFKRNIRLRDNLISSGAKINWFEAKGGHNYQFYNLAMEEAFRWISQ